MDSQVAVKAVIVNKHGKYLIVNEPKKRWQAVGGRLESGERLRIGLAREVFEETGITEMEIKDVVHVDEWFATPEDREVHIVALFFLCVTNDPQVVVSEEHDKFAWIMASELDNYDVEPEIKQAILQAEKVRSK